MNLFRDYSIKNKIIGIVLLITLSTIGIGFTIAIYKDVQYFKADLINNIVLNARLISEYCIGPIIFDDKKSVGELLSRLQAIPYIMNGYIYDYEGKLYAAYDRDLNDRPVMESFSRSPNYFEDEFFYFTQPMNYQSENYGTIYLRASTKQLDQKIQYNLFTMLSLMTVLMAFSYFLAWKLQSIISSPLLELAAVTEKISREEDYSLQVVYEGRDEIGLLFKGFNNMLKQIHQRKLERDLAEEAIRKGEAKLRTIIEASPNAILVTDMAGKILECNQAGLKMFGAIDRQRFLWQNGIKLIVPEERVFAIENLRKVRQQLSQKNIQYHLIKQDGTIFPAEVSGSLIQDPDTASEAFVILIKDITEQKQAEAQIKQLNEELERRVIERTTELETANNELKEFAYIVSHDLKAPLRGISQLSQWLAQDYGTHFDTQGKEMLNMLIGRAKRMSNLIDGILQYSRVGRSKVDFIPVDLKKLMREVVDLLDPPANIKIDIVTDLPIVVGDYVRLEQVFQNLIGNAIKFMDKTDGMIRIGCEDGDQCWKFWVKDNGPGIDEKYHDRIFQIFQSLVPRDELESTGIGLTLVKKIVTLYGGKVWLKSEIGAGTTFYFTLPKGGLRNEKQETDFTR
ncbi:PAS domain S-box protein [candidate division KSB1 bacterium]|nr:PAS domain S-box protein [candidate division KSB1 bacterium]